jgi:sulfoxide reductase heme-binding subunit YedZ
LVKREAIAKAVVFALSLLPFVLFLDDYWSGALASPWRTLIQDTGLWSMRFLVLGLCVSPLVRLTGLAGLNAFRRMIGLFGAFYAAVHVFAWTRQYGFDWPFLFDEIVLRLFLTIGVLATLLLLPLAVTSADVMHRALGPQRWRRLHTLMYPMIVAALIHYLLVRGLRRDEVMVDLVLITVAVVMRLWPRRAAA